MAYITSTEYQSIIGEAAPNDFDVILNIAEDCFDAHTIYSYMGRDVSALPQCVQKKLKSAIACQVQYISQMGGAAGVNDSGGDLGSVTLGRFSYSQSTSGRASGSSVRADTLPLCSAAAVNMPFLIAYARGAFGL